MQCQSDFDIIIFRVQLKENDKEKGSDLKHFCFGHGIGAHVCGIAGISDTRLKEMNSGKMTQFFRQVSFYFYMQQQIIMKNMSTNKISLRLFQDENEDCIRNGGDQPSKSLSL